MLQCQDCEYFFRGPNGEVGFRCDPFSTIKEPECLTKWQLIKSNQLSRQVERMVRAYEATLQMYEKLAPMQEKMFRHMEREIDEFDETESWKLEQDEDEGEGHDPEDLIR